MSIYFFSRFPLITDIAQLNWQNIANPAIAPIVGFMGRQPLNSTEDVKAAIAQLLADGSGGAPVTTALFRRLISARSVRARLGGGDPAWINREIRNHEPAFIQASAARHLPPDTPDAVMAHAFAFWREAVEVARGEAAAVRAEADRTIAAADLERDNAVAKTELLRTALDDARQDLSRRDETLGALRATIEGLNRQLTEARQQIETSAAELATCVAGRTQEERQYREQIEAHSVAYAGLSRKLLTEIDAQRRTLDEQSKGREQALRDTRRLLDEVTQDRDRLANTLMRGPGVGRDRRNG
ncbi:molecular chaperone GrpE (heat shock protein) [Paraburkholderia sp. HC6.4b]|uniref:DNA-binding protein n=1 Tax=unclassified Paraburkholderia TaxID=2615204 RepID=UPI001610C3B9|nr:MULTISPECIES: DNA-binding protein [unclassified Paraburkholderia]MBB5413403.1 molecular chaperone GrpE (heat shock protein) [Paraburkholderia sp. HC6.4b]MBB5455684.1 molecular chaperone GrpE (heat shock protein) [Paraburkholderia sp. Kb1A]